MNQHVSTNDHRGTSGTAHTPRVALTMGDPAGVGPEVLVAAWPAMSAAADASLLAVAHPELLRRAARLLELPIEVQEIGKPEEAHSTARLIPCVPVGDQRCLHVAPGEVTAAGGQAAYDAVVLATRWALEQRIDALATAPLSKAALHRSGHPYPGHTELLGDLCGVGDTAMMLYLPSPALPSSPGGLGVVHATLHMALRDVFATLSPELILARCHLAAAAMQSLGVGEPRLAVCALNPHAGEGGLFGDEEQRIIAPAIAAACRQGLNVTGPLPPDSVFARAAAGEFDGVVAMYHDQGHIALKMLGMHQAVNITLGLPIIRTSVAHGTAADKAWHGTADGRGMIAATTVAIQLAQQRRRQETRVQ